MYKITLYDHNCCPIYDSTTFWFTEVLKEFEKKWIPMQSTKNVETIERYYRSKLGEIVTDYYSDDDPSLNIVQSVDCEVLHEKEFEYSNKNVSLENVYGDKTQVLFDKLKIILRVQRCNDTYYLIGQYFGYGCRRISDKKIGACNNETCYSPMHFFGNPIAQYKSNVPYTVNYTNDKELFNNDTVETFVWIPIKEVNAQYRINELTMTDLSLLLRDIVGEAG